jgi:hypothetical protein
MTPTRLGGNDVRVNDTKPVTQVEMDADRASRSGAPGFVSGSPRQSAPVSGMEWNLSGASVGELPDCLSVIIGSPLWPRNRKRGHCEQKYGAP